MMQSGVSKSRTPQKVAVCGWIGGWVGGCGCEGRKESGGTREGRKPCGLFDLRLNPLEGSLKGSDRDRGGRSAARCGV